MVDVLQTVLDLLSTNWLSDNTDNFTPTFGKITDFKRIDFNDRTKPDWILVHRSQRGRTPGGIGKIEVSINETLNIDIRTYGEENEDHWIKVREEVERILDAHILNPSSDFPLLEPDSQQQDLSDKTFHVWRQLIPVSLINYNKSR